jgi:uncharacterized repeat protein (TIGR02543 family)
VDTVTFTFDRSVLLEDALVEVVVSFTVLDVSAGVSNSASVVVNGLLIGSDGADLYRVTYLAGGLGVLGSVPVDEVLYESGATVVVLDHAGSLTRTGYNFTSWFYNETIYDAGDSFVISENVKLTATWHPLNLNVYTISYVLNGGINVNGNPASYVITDLPLEIAPPYRAGDTFLYWMALYANGTEQILLNSIIPKGVSGNIQLTAYWRSDFVYNIFYELEGGVNAVENPVSYVVADLPVSIIDPSRAGYAFAGWTVTYADNTKVSSQFSYSIPLGTVGDVLLTAVWNPEIYHIFYELDGGINAANNPTSYTVEILPLAIIDPTKESNTFLGWMVTYANGSTAGSVFDFNISKGTTGDIVLTAHWQTATVRYSVIYNGNANTGGTPPTDGNSPYVAGSQVSVLGPGSLSRSGYTLLGWSTSSNTNTATYTAGSTFTITANTVLYAVWRQNTSPTSYYTVSYQPGTYGAFTVQITRNLAYGDLTPAAPKVTGESGWRFTGWSPVPSTTVRGDAVYVAQWVQEQSALFTVQFVDWNGALIESQNVISGDDAVAPKSPTREGYIFTGWDQKYTNVTTSLTITAQYTDNPQPLQSWALVNLLLSLAGIVLAVAAVVYVLLQQKRQREKQTNDPSSTKQPAQNSKQNKLYRNLCLIIAFILGIVGVVVFLLTQDLSQPMGFVDQWSVLHVILFMFEILGLFFVFYPKTHTTTQKT